MEEEFRGIFDFFVTRPSWVIVGMYSGQRYVRTRETIFLSDKRDEIIATVLIEDDVSVVSTRERTMRHARWNFPLRGKEHSSATVFLEMFETTREE